MDMIEFGIVVILRIYGELFNVARKYFHDQLTLKVTVNGRPNFAKFRRRNLIIFLSFVSNKFVKLVAGDIGLKLHGFAAACPKNTAIPAVTLCDPPVRLSCGRRAVKIPPNLIMVVFVTPANKAIICRHVYSCMLLFYLFCCFCQYFGTG